MRAIASLAVIAMYMTPPLLDVAVAQAVPEQLTIDQLKSLRSSYTANAETPLQRRDAFVKLMASIRPIAGVRSKKVFINGIPGLWIYSRNSVGNAGRVILYLHGGGYYSGSSETHRNLAATLSKYADVDVFVADYRLAPEAGFPAAIDDAERAYRGLLAQNRPACAVAVAGESAGGGLALAMAMRVKRDGIPEPAALFVMSPFINFDGRSSSMQANAANDSVVTPNGVRGLARMLFGDEAARPPESEPLKSDIRGLPPTLIQVGEAETLLDDASALLRAEEGAGIDVRFHAYPGVMHQWQLFPTIFAPARNALAEGGAFLSVETCRR
jgi:epsilon-lactone hydrolase